MKINNSGLTIIAIILFTFSGVLIGVYIGKSMSNSDFDHAYSTMEKTLTLSEHSNIESAIMSLEISVKCGDPVLIALTLEMAKSMSTTAGGYGAEKIQKIEDELKQKKSVRFPDEQDQQYSL